MAVEDIIDGMSGYLTNGGMADSIAMIEGIKIVEQIASSIIGVLVVLVVTLLPIIVGIEVCYINFPVFQDSYNRIYNRLKGRAASVFGIVIRDARMAVEESKTNQIGRSANWIYLQIKCKSIFICFIIIFMVLGPGQFLVKQALTLANNIILVFS